MHPLGGFQAWQLSGSYTKNDTKRIAARKTVVIPAQGAIFVLELDATPSTAIKAR